MRPVLISKFSTPVLTVGPTETLSAEGAENSWSVFWAMALEVDGAIMTGRLSRVISEEVHEVKLFSKVTPDPE
jgi:hypothetical protein